MGKMTQSYHDFIKSEFVINALKRSFETGCEVKIKEYHA